MRDPFPYFAEYPAPWLHDTDRLDLTLEELGAVFLLRCYAWVNEDSSLKKSTLGKLLRVTPAKLRKLLPSVLPMFKDEDDRIAVEEFREQKVSLLAKRAFAQKAANARHGRAGADAGADAGALQTQSERIASKAKQSTSELQQRSSGTAAAAPPAPKSLRVSEERMEGPNFHPSFKEGGADRSPVPEGAAMELVRNLERRWTRTSEP